MNRNCLFCYKPLKIDEIDFHAKCSKKIFGQAVPPALQYSEKDLDRLGLEVIKKQSTVTGVQPKLSLDISSNESVKRFTIVGLWGRYILKPPSQNYPQLPEVEDLTMHLASISKINVVPHSLIRMSSGSLAYITRRIDRPKGRKLQMEDMCQLTERLTEDKYNGSYEQIAKVIWKYSATPGLDIVNFAELLLFCFITGNADMHLKNFSLISTEGIGMTLSPAYDLLATRLVNPQDDEELALTLNGKKKKINYQDFRDAFTTFGLDTKQQANIFEKIRRSAKGWTEMIDVSFLSSGFKKQFSDLIIERLERLT
jgi:serine/threonine-protein kinase HipA